MYLQTQDVPTQEALGWVSAVAAIGAAVVPGVVDVFAGRSKKEGEAAALKQMLAQQQALEAQRKARQQQMVPLYIGGGVLLLAVVLLGGRKAKDS